MSIDRRSFVEACAALGVSSAIFPGALYAEVKNDETQTVTTEQIQAAAQVAGLSFTEDELELMKDDVNQHLEEFSAMREHSIPNHRVPAMTFDPTLGGASLPDGSDGMTFDVPSVSTPETTPDIAYAGVAEMAALLRQGDVTSVELTRIALDRLTAYDDELKAVVTLTEERAMDAARKADAEIANGGFRSLLHGIPYGAKDLLAVEGTTTTWGAEPFKTQTIDETATVIQKLDDAGAVLVAKLTLGALAWGDVWFGGTTKNPWNLDQGSSGSSAGPGSAVAAGCVPFAIGSETLGSIVSPSTRNGVTGHRPTFGAVSRHGAMTLSWTMDKLGPMTRSALDAALVYDVIRGGDPKDPASRDVPFAFDPSSDLSALSVGYVESAFGGDYDNADADQAVLDTLRGMGVDLQPIELPSDLPVGAMLATLDVEAAAAFDELTRSGRDDELTRQVENAWPNVFRAARVIPAVEFVQMNRLRVRLMEEMHAAMDGIDVFVSPSFQGGTLAITNLTGHPCVCVPNAFRDVEDQPAYRKQPGSISFVGALYRDDAPLRLAHAYQQATDFHTRRPPIR